MTMPFRHKTPHKTIRGGYEKDKPGYLPMLNPVMWLMHKKFIEHHASEKKDNEKKAVGHSTIHIKVVAEYVENYLKDEKKVEQHIVQPLIGELKRHIWPKGVFRFRESHLDLLCQVIPRIWNFLSWNEFVSKFGNNPIILDGENFMYNEFEKLDDEDRQKVIVAAHFLYCIYTMNLDDDLINNVVTEIKDRTSRGIVKKTHQKNSKNLNVHIDAIFEYFAPFYKSEINFTWQIWNISIGIEHRNARIIQQRQSAKMESMYKSGPVINDPILAAFIAKNESESELVAKNDFELSDQKMRSQHEIPSKIKEENLTNYDSLEIPAEAK